MRGEKFQFIVTVISYRGLGGVWEDGGDNSGNFILTIAYCLFPTL